MTTFDASALLAYLQGEPGAALVAESLDTGGSCSAANWSEVAQKVTFAGANWQLARGLLLSYPLIVAPVTIEDAEAAAQLWVMGTGLSLADRLCLALGQRLQGDILTADKAWAGLPRVTVVR